MSASAPGKLVLLGEYAVLGGAPALVAAIDRRARVQLERPVAAWSVGGLALVRTEEGMRAGRPGLAVVESVLTELLQKDSVAPASLHIDTTQFVGPSGAKLGFGSSAAVAVALWGALQGAADRPAAFARIEPAHRRAQGGQGSGVDVAASLWGGVLRYRRGRPPTPAKLPRRLQLLAVDSGKAVRTADLVDAVARAAPSAELGRLSELAERAAAAEEELAVFFDLVEQYHEALAALGRAAGVPIVSDEHAAIARAVHRAGGVYKPSGAGGGDVGVAFADSAATLDAIAGAVAAAGFRPLCVRVDPVGLEITPGPV